MDCRRYTIDDYIIDKIYDEGFFGEKLSLVKKSHQFWTWYRQALDCSNNTTKHYNRKRLPKKGGTCRHIDIPDTILKTHQRYINTRFLNTLPISKYAFAYCKGKSIKDVAEVHFNAEKNTLLRLDLKDFFGSISAKRVYDFFKTNIIADEEFIVFLTNICCLNGAIPQGAPTSPTISNLIMYILDEVIGAYSDGNGIKYTRYSDDMFFSFNKEDITEKEIIFFVAYMMREEGFKLNYAKTKIMRRNSHRLSVLGINTKDKLQVAKAYRKDVRQKMYFINKYGLKNHMVYIGASNTKEEEIKYLQVLLGRVNHILFINQQDEEMSSYRQQLSRMVSDRIKALNRSRFSALSARLDEILGEDIPF